MSAFTRRGVRRLRFAGGFSSTPLAPWSAGQSRSSRMLIPYRLRNHRRNKTSTDEQFPVIDYVLSMQNIASKLVLQGFSRLIGRAASDQWSAARRWDRPCRADNSAYADYTFSRAPQFELEKWEIYNNTWRHVVRRNETVGNRRPLCVYNNMHAGTEVGCGGKSVGLGGRGREPSLQHKRKKVKIK